MCRFCFHNVLFRGCFVEKSFNFLFGNQQVAERSGCPEQLAGDQAPHRLFGHTQYLCSFFHAKCQPLRVWTESGSQRGGAVLLQVHAFWRRPIGLQWLEGVEHGLFIHAPLGSYTPFSGGGFEPLSMRVSHGRTQ